MVNFNVFNYEIFINNHTDLEQIWIMNTIGLPDKANV